MMTTWRKKLFLLGLLALLAAGGWLLTSRAPLGPDSVVRQQALRGSLGPAGMPGSPQPAPAAIQRVAQPYVVDIRQVTTGQGVGNSQYERWLRGEIDLDENESPLSDVEIAALQAEARALPPSAAVQPIKAQSLHPALSAPTVVTDFESLDIDDCCNSGRLTPPDPELAVGPDHVIAVVNSALAIYDKNGGTLLGPVRFVDFMAANPDCNGDDFLFDPNAIYDELADRFILGMDSDGTHYCVAASQTGDPTGFWSVYAFTTPAGEFFDYPHAGVGQDAIYVGSNQFTSSFVGGLMLALDKSAMYAGGAASSVQQDLGLGAFTPQPLNLHGAAQGSWPGSGPHYIVANAGPGSSNLRFYSWDDPFGANLLTLETTLNLNNFIGNVAGFPLSQPQNGGSPITANDWRVLDFEYRNGRGWVTMAISCNPGGGTVNCVRWAQLDLNTASILQAGDFASAGEYRSFPDLAVSHCNAMAVGYTKTSSSSFPGIFVTGRTMGDPLGTVQAELLLRAGDQTYAAHDSPPWRWGDYTGMTIDPDGETFWYLGEYSKAGVSDPFTNWGTYIGAFQYGPCDFAETFLPVILRP